MLRKGLLVLTAIAAFGFASVDSTARAGDCDRHYHDDYHHHHHYHHRHHRHAYYGYYGYGDYGYGGPVVIRSFYGPRYAPYHGYYGRGYGYHSGYGCGRGGVNFSIGF